MRTSLVEEWQWRAEDARRKAERWRGEVISVVRERRPHELVPFTGQTAGMIHDVLPAGEIMQDEETLRHFSRFAKVYAAWKPYRMELVKEASESGLPVVRHPFVHYPEDPEVLGLEYQFMVGPNLMVAPVVDPGEEMVEVYLPAGRWVHLWSGREYGSVEKGVYEMVRAPIGEPAVFYKEGSDVGRWFRETEQ